jgi:hypothetical protein
MDVPLPDAAYRVEFDREGRDGHAFGRPPGLRATQWPRSRVNGLPMAHLFTVRVPAPYRCAGAELAGLSVFQADDHVSRKLAGVADVFAGGDPPAHGPAADAFWSALVGYARGGRHQRERYREDGIGGGWAWIWLTDTELAGPPGALPDPATREPEYHSQDGVDAWRADRTAAPLRVVARDSDPNVGKRPDDPESGYVDMDSEEGDRLGLSDRFFGQCHFGGTATPPNGGADHGPFFFAFHEELGDANLGGGDSPARIDLATDLIDWP